MGYEESENEVSIMYELEEGDQNLEKMSNARVKMVIDIFYVSNVDYGPKYYILKYNERVGYNINDQFGLVKNLKDYNIYGHVNANFNNINPITLTQFGEQPFVLENVMSIHNDTKYSRLYITTNSAEKNLPTFRFFSELLAIN